MPAVPRARHSAAAATRQGLYQFISVVRFQSIIRCASLCSAPFHITINGWNVQAAENGTTFLNESSEYGMFVSIENV
ncbi:hypothetical protein [Mycobacterium sp. E2733]|uniref:hypothetical protein n=1 Tax=Mycobacterium sp. E2733 TaxID=1834138 RepID=UPI0012EA7438|nr:hypothetical protein [Mycobacterium sp. E2733]